MTDREHAYHEAGHVDGRDGTMRRRVVVSSDDWQPPTVRLDLRRGGGRLDATVCLAPDDARSLAALLLAEADHVDAGQAVASDLLEEAIAISRADVEQILQGPGTGGDAAPARTTVTR